MLKVHEELSERFAENLMKKAIIQCAEEEGLKLIREIISNKYVIHLNYIIFFNSIIDKNQFLFVLNSNKNIKK